MSPFAVEVDTSILLAQEEAPYARHDHNEGTIVKRTIVNIPLVELLSLVLFVINIYYLYSSFEILFVMTIWSIIVTKMLIHTHIHTYSHTHTHNK